ncbi:hypothetical protein QVZ43_10930 [Marinobacter sp. chi1]|uniref:DUF3987 domain-containing protein n=1 Tax=Marinobacter suaedae TaxID=3057675 RepID=A0ABT8W1W7_9GAMM|nr:hypothetical protein [Marinobacter sp. chi1]MDO3722237.1 hypothetical protein [Marinobacter sp. chi1]
MSLLDPELFVRRDPFEHYGLSLEEPLKAQHKELTLSFGFIIWSCQEQLAGRSTEELQYAVEFLNWLMGEAQERHKTESWKQIKQGKETVFQTEPRQLLTLFEDYDLDDQEEFPNAAPEDYFAALAMAKCYEAMETHERLTPYEKGETSFVVEGYPEDLQLSLYHNAIRARDSLLSEARDLVAFIDGIRFAQLRTRNDGKRGAKAKNTRFARLNRRLMDVYDERYQHLTNRHAASRLYEEFRDEVEGVLRTDDPIQRISIWIGRHRKTAK